MASIKGLFREFLETSTIHGLQHIGGEKQKLAKLVWVAIVVCGFSIAAFLIMDSVKGWEESPVSTSVETLPISEVQTEVENEIWEIIFVFLRWPFQKWPYVLQRAQILLSTMTS